ncbi:MAG TPA: hypothetical protein VGW80_08160 [Solirubrobacterales bacterium]|jgi:hypothetical protein|nr:hypothetical protein [Solirubrobacterales bacterium]
MAQLATFLLPALPLLALLLTLLLGRYPGCEAIVRLSERLASHGEASHGGLRRAALPPPPRSFAPSGGLLIALGLARRPPPIAA